MGEAIKGFFSPLYLDVWPAGEGAKEGMDGSVLGLCRQDGRSEVLDGENSI